MAILITKITITYNPALINFSQQMDSNLLFETNGFSIYQESLKNKLTELEKEEYSV